MRWLWYYSTITLHLESSLTWENNHWMGCLLKSLVSATPDTTSVIATTPNISKRDSEIRSYELVRLKGCQAFECYWSTDHFKVKKFGPLCNPKGINSLILSGTLIPTVIKSVSSEHLARAHQTLCVLLRIRPRDGVYLTISSDASWIAMPRRHWEILLNIWIIGYPSLPTALLIVYESSFFIPF